MKTNLNVELTLVTPELAKNYLKFNPKNRDVSETNLLFLTREMKEDRFIENGESIVFDTNGMLKDGQHRLEAIIKSGKSYFIPIVRGVQPNSMATYDTGKNRSAGDVLKINGFKYTNSIAAFILSRQKFVTSKSKSAVVKGRPNRSEKLSNQQVLEYCQENYDWLLELIKNTDSIYLKQKPKVLGLNAISLIAYILGGKNPSANVYDFLKNLTGTIRIENSAPSYLYTKLYNSRINKEPLNFYWVLGMTIRAYNYYIDGNPAVNYFKFTIDQDLPKVNKL